MSLRGVPNHSTSRTGIDEATTSWPPAGTFAVIARATPGSDSVCSAPSAASIAARAMRSASRHSSSHVRSLAAVDALCSKCEQNAPIGACTCRAPTKLGSETNPPATPRHASRPERRATGPAPSRPAACRAAAPPRDDEPRRTRRGGAPSRTARPRHRASDNPTTGPPAPATPWRRRAPAPGAGRRHRCRPRSRRECCRRARRDRRRSTSNGGEIDDLALQREVRLPHRPAVRGTAG